MEILSEIKIIWGYLRTYKRAVIKTAVLAVIFSIITALVPYIYGRLVDLVSMEPFSMDFVLALMGAWALTSLCSAILMRIISIRGDFISIDAANDLICEASQHIINLSLSFHKEKKLGEILSRIHRAGSALREIIQDVVFWILPRVLTIFVGLFILSFIDWRLSLGAFMIFCVSIIITIYRMPLILKASDKHNEKSEKGSGVLSDSFLNIQTIKSCAAENFQQSKIKDVYKKEITMALKEVVAFWDNTRFVYDVVFSLGFLITFSYAMFLLKDQQISSGELIMFLGYLNIIRMPLNDFLYQWFSLQKGMTAIKRIRKLLKINLNQSKFL